MVPVLLSIRPEHAEKIFNGSKEFEYRRKFTSKEVNLAYVYASSPTQSVIGYIEIQRVIKMKPGDLWELTKVRSGLTEFQYNQYFINCDIAYAIEIKKAELFKHPNKLSKYCLERPPQSYQFLYDI
ncbi:MAG: ASCH domain-containing protein [Rectinema sp.]